MVFTQLAEQKKTKKFKDAFLKKLINSFCRQSFIDFGILKNKIDQNFARISIGKVSFIKSQGISRVNINTNDQIQQLLCTTGIGGGSCALLF